ncbi:hypothetical protein Gpo141_00002720 [Globisporangium polare]
MATPVLMTALQLVLPWCSALALPRFLYGKTLEEDVLRSLTSVVASIAALMLLTSVSLYSSSSKRRTSAAIKAAHGVVALGVGAALFHVVICLFGAPFKELVPQTLLLAVLLASLALVPAAVCLGPNVQDLVAVLINLRAHSREELLLASSAIGATLGAYLGALPIPLDWDRPWQQWPLTCVYGALAGHALGLVAGTSASLWWLRPSRQAKRE